MRDRLTMLRLHAGMCWAGGLVRVCKGRRGWRRRAKWGKGNLCGTAAYNGIPQHSAVHTAVSCGVYQAVSTQMSTQVSTRAWVTAWGVGKFAQFGRCMDGTQSTIACQNQLNVMGKDAPYILLHGLLNVHCLAQYLRSLAPQCSQPASMITASAHSMHDNSMRAHSICPPWKIEHLRQQDRCWPLLAARR